MKKLGLIGYPLSHSFSKQYFTEKFEKESISGWEYELYPLENIGLLPDLLDKEKQLIGLNVTIPYKTEVIPFLDELSEEAEEIGAVNTIKIDLITHKTKGYNTDTYGFEKSLQPLLMPWHKKALVFGTGGGSKAVAYVLQKLGIMFNFVSRNEHEGYTYNDLNQEIMLENTILINTTPLGMFPNISTCPPITYQFLSEGHLCYDLVYNPEETLFLHNAKAQGATTKNGLEMLHFQAEKAWQIWNTL